jgi:hypothetical protein
MGEGEGEGDLRDYFTASGGQGGFQERVWPKAKLFLLLAATPHCTTNVQIL